jgi:hypothetical protein
MKCNHNWIRLNEKRPPVATEVLVTNNISQIAIGNHLWIAGPMWNGQEWTGFQGDMQIHALTHWCPIPLPTRKQMIANGQVERPIEPQEGRGK